MAVMTEQGLLEGILAVELEFHSINEITAGDGLYFIELPEQKDAAQPFVYLKKEGDDTVRYRCSVNQLAALRVFSQAPGSFSIAWSQDFRGAAGCSYFQSSVLERKSAGTLNLNSLRFKCIGQMRRRNDLVEPKNTPVYQRKCYTGIDSFTTQRDALKKANGGEWFNTVDGRVAMKGLRETLEKSGLKPEFVADAAAWEVKIPVFVLI
jgi:hypothetical protein